MNTSRGTEVKYVIITETIFVKNDFFWICPHLYVLEQTITSKYFCFLGSLTYVI
jgi:hypothetical protein